MAMYDDSQGQTLWTTAAATCNRQLMTLAQNDPDFPPSAMTETVEQLVFDWTFEEHQQHLGLDHRTHSYVAEVHPATGQPVSANEDEPHKLKNVVQGIQSQPRPSHTKHC
ncbi:hypothetical protein ABBQ32_008743 [Trebouxia sp. C0010 RCD-2024]